MTCTYHHQSQHDEQYTRKGSPKDEHESGVLQTSLLGQLTAVSHLFRPHPLLQPPFPVVMPNDMRDRVVQHGERGARAGCLAARAEQAVLLVARTLEAGCHRAGRPGAEGAVAAVPGVGRMYARPARGRRGGRCVVDQRCRLAPRKCARTWRRGRGGTAEVVDGLAMSIGGYSLTETAGIDRSMLLVVGGRARAGVGGHCRSSRSSPFLQHRRRREGGGPA